MEFDLSFVGVCQKYGLKKGPKTFELYLGYVGIFDYELSRIPGFSYRWSINAVDTARLAALEPYQSLKLDNAGISDKGLRESIKYWACDMLYQYRGWLYSMLGIAYPKPASAAEEATEGQMLPAPYNAEDLAAILSFEKVMAGNAAKLEAGRLAKQDDQRQQHLPLLGKYAKIILNKLDCFRNLNITTRRNIVYDILVVAGLVGKYAVSDYDYTSKDDFQLNDADVRDEKAKRVISWISSYERTSVKFKWPELDERGWMQAEYEERNRIRPDRERMKKLFEEFDF